MLSSDPFLILTPKYVVVLYSAKQYCPLAVPNEDLHLLNLLYPQSQ